MKEIDKEQAKLIEIVKELRQALEYIEFSSHFYCEKYNYKDCDANTQEAYEAHLNIIGNTTRQALLIAKQIEEEYEDK